MAPLMRLLLLSVALLAAKAAAQTPEEVPSPEAFLGRPLGARWTSHSRIVSYLREVAAASPRVSLARYGASYEGRPLLLLAITSEANHARMEALRERLALLADPRRIGEHSPEELVKGLPVVVWLSYNVHGNEPSPSEACLRVVHRLASAADEETRAWLEGSVVLVDPCLNPDGRERYTSWFTGVMGRRPDPDPQAFEHDEPWPGGRYNHYLFDLNRDWAFATQRETRARLPLFVSWTPQVHVDFHEMGYESTYFFFPAEKPINSNLPDHTLKWGRIFGRGNARAFDARGWPYYTAESFDLFYPGYGDSWPSFTGAIGMTYEQGGHGRAGLAVERRDGTVLTLAARLAHHAEASFATIRTAVTNRRELLLDFHAFRRSAVEEGRTGSVRAFILPPAADPARLRALVRGLRLQGIEVGLAQRAFTLPRVEDMQGAMVQDHTFPAGSAVVSLEQPLKRLAKTLLEPRARIRELYFYDVSAWSLPLAYGVDVYQSPVPVEVPLSAAAELRPPAGGVGEGPREPVAWLLPYATRGALEALSELLVRGVRVRAAHKRFTLGGRRYSRGTLVVRRSANAGDVRAVLQEVGGAHGVTFRPAASGYTEQGADLGSRSVEAVVPPFLAVAGGQGVSPTSLGATRYLLDRVLELPHTVLALQDLERMDLDRYTAVVLPEARVGREQGGSLRRFVRSGGVVAAFGRAAFSLVSGEDPPCRVEPARPDPEDGGREPGAEEGPRRAPWLEELREMRRRSRQPGSIFRVELDPAHPLAFGYRAEVAVFKAGTRSFDLEGPGLHVGRFARAAPLSGYVPRKVDRALRGTSYLSVDRQGRGAFVLFADDPNFRGAWRGMTRLFVNAVLLLPRRHVRR